MAWVYPLTNFGIVTIYIFIKNIIINLTSFYYYVCISLEEKVLTKLFNGWIREYSQDCSLSESLLKSQEAYDPVTIFKQQELSRVIYELLRGLSPYEEFVLTNLMEEVSVVEISKKLGFPVRRIYTIKKRAISKMRRPERIRKIMKYIY